MWLCPLAKLGYSDLQSTKLDEIEIFFFSLVFIPENLSSCCFSQDWHQSIPFATYQSK